MHSLPTFTGMEVSKLRRLATWVIDIICILLLFTVAVRTLPTRLVPVEHFRLLILAISFGYYASAELLFQRTVGKALLHTRVVTVDDDKPGAGRLLLRTLCRFLPLEPLSLLLSSRALGWHDTFSGTKVVYLDY
jgi:uncharacterized RDD family membrane protein YckC